MNTGEDIYGMRKIVDLTRGVSMVLLLLHFYFICYGAFREWGLTATLSDRLLSTIGRTGLFDKPSSAKLLSLAFLVVSLLGSGGRKDGKLGYLPGLVTLVAGIAAFFGSVLIFNREEDIITIACLYMGVCFAGWLLILTGGIRLSRVIAYSLRKTFFRSKQGGFPQEERLIETPFSINLKALYKIQGETRPSHINIINPRRGLLLIGSPGSGKTWFIIQPAMEQLMEKGFAMLVFDFKYDKLTKYAYGLFCKNRENYPDTARFYSINFNDLSRSHRCNLIDPMTLSNTSDAIGISRTIMLSINNTWSNKQGDFFVESPINFVAALIWFLKKYKDGIYCTLPHVIELAQTPYDKLFTILNAEVDVETLINSFAETFKNKTFEVLDSQMASTKIPLGRVASADLYYILTGNDLDLRINDPAHPKVLCVGGDPARQEALAPILSLYIDRVNRLINQPACHPCALVLDEFASVRSASVLQTVAVGREHNIISILAVQDASQLRILYSRAEADTILNMTGNLICGQVGGETARWVSERFPSVMEYKTTVSVNSMDTSVSKAEHTNPSIEPATIATLSSGEFVGVLADDPGNEMALKVFHAKVVRERSRVVEASLPVVREVGPAEVEENFLRVKREVKELVEDEMERIDNDPVLRGKTVRKN